MSTPRRPPPPPGALSFDLPSNATGFAVSPLSSSPMIRAEIIRDPERPPRPDLTSGLPRKYLKGNFGFRTRCSATTGACPPDLAPDPVSRAWMMSREFRGTSEANSGATRISPEITLGSSPPPPHPETSKARATLMERQKAGRNLISMSPKVIPLSAPGRTETSFEDPVDGRVGACYNRRCSQPFTIAPGEKIAGSLSSGQS